jgi:hypothetical protein
VSVSLARHFIDDTLLQLNKLKKLAEKAVAQAGDEALFVRLDPESNSIAIIMKHMAGNMRSRWTDFLTSDGEKPDRERDNEFEDLPGDSPVRVRMLWEDGWRRTLDAIGSLKEDDLMRTVTIRGEPHSVVEAINRQVSHYAMHVGQIVFLAKHLAGGRWKSLSIPRGQSKTFDVSRRGPTYEVKPPGSTA